MASIAIMIGGAVINAVAFSGTNYLFSHLNKKQAEKERKKRVKAEEDLRKAQIDWAHERQRKIDSDAQFLQKEQKASVSIDEMDDAARELYLARHKEFLPKPVLSDFYHPSEQQKTGEVAFIFGGLAILSLGVYKYL